MELKILVNKKTDCIYGRITEEHESLRNNIVSVTTENRKFHWFPIEYFTRQGLIIRKFKSRVK